VTLFIAMVNGLLPNGSRESFGAESFRDSKATSADASNFTQICGLFALNMGKNRLLVGTGDSRLPVRFNSNTLKKAAMSQREGDVFSHSRGILAEHRYYPAADRVAAVQIGADHRNRGGGFRRVGGSI
jgi:hypothetical protein